MLNYKLGLFQFSCDWYNYAGEAETKCKEGALKDKKEAENGESV